MALSKVPDCGAAVTVAFPVPPDEIVIEDGLAPKVKVGLSPPPLPPLPPVPPPPVPPVVPVEQDAVKPTGPDIWFFMLGLPTAWT